jgi:hypothetical protein
MTESGRLREKILAMVAELHRFDDALVKKTEKLMQDGHADAAAIRARPEWQQALSKSWEAVFEQHDALYQDMRTGFEARFRPEALLLIEQASNQLGDVEPPRPSSMAHGHPDSEVKRQLEISRAYSCIRNGFRSEGAIASPGQLHDIADYLQTLADRLE